jgi:hypothetical protein
MSEHGHDCKLGHVRRQQEMMMSEETARDYWKDETSYTQGDKERIPRSWVRWDGLLRVTVHRHIHYPPDQWLLSCAPWFDKRELESKDADAAKDEAVTLVLQVLEGARKSLNRYS